QFRLDHDQGSSYGDSRIVRRVYPDPLYTGLMADAYAYWYQLQEEFLRTKSIWHKADPDSRLFERHGGIFCGPADHPQIAAAQKALALSGVAYEVLDAKACRKRFPAFALHPEEVALYEPGMAYARASNCLRAAASLAQQQGAQ